MNAPFATVPREVRDLPARLREETMDLHRAIEAQPAFARLSDPGLTRDAYVAHLARLLGFYAPLEARLAAHREPALDLDRRLVKADRLRGDLAALGLSTPSIGALPLWGGRDLGDLSTAWGYVYVSEGATLGGRLISRDLGPRLGLCVEAGLSFHQCYGGAAGAMWQAFRSATSAAAAEGRIDPDRVVAGARLAFTDLARWMDRPA